MEYSPEKREIILSRKLNNLDKLAIEFIQVLEKYTDYVIISGYVSILLGRTRATEDVDVFIEKISSEKFSKLYSELKNAGFWCLNAEKESEIFSYLYEGLAVRFAKKGKVAPNFEVKFPKIDLDKETFNDFVIVFLKEGKIKISSLERQIAFKRYFLKSEKDMEDALHIEELFKDQLDYEKINNLKEVIEKVGKK
ncbi:MAG: hypothetical protein KKE23_04725 [Nanoarchaeota archaeon]|nr:hypothetical protein [Nanoarchaeota archaeon]